MNGNCLVAQSGGPTAVINSSACGAIQEAMRQPAIGRIYAARNGVEGILNHEVFDLGFETKDDIAGLRVTPSAALGSCRHRIKTEVELAAVLDVFRKRGIRYFFYIGGNDSQDTADRIGTFSKRHGYDLRCMGIPKTIDNDLCHTDHCPGYGSVIKYLATMVMEAGRDTEALHTADPVNIVEVMGRNAGWIAAGTALGKRDERDAPHLVVMPEVPFDAEAFKACVDDCLARIGWCVAVVSEGARAKDGAYLSEQRGRLARDSFGHSQLGGAALQLKRLVEDGLKVKARFAIPSTIQRNGAHFASLCDAQEAYRVGREAVKLAVRGVSGKMVTLERIGDNPYRCRIGTVALADVANCEKRFPLEWIRKDGFFVTDRFLKYARPLIQGQVKPAMEDGLPKYVRLKMSGRQHECKR